MRLVVLISGGGTTLQNLIDRIQAGTLRATIEAVVASRAKIQGVERARNAGLPVHIIRKSTRNAEVSSAGEDHVAEYSDRLFATIRPYQPDLVCLAGWLHLLRIPADFQHRVINVHPALLPAFGGPGMYGTHVHEAVLAYGAKVSGCTVHFADNTYDTGPILVQRTVPVLDDDTPQTLAARVYQAECEAFPEAIQLVSRGVRVEGRRVVANNA